ncbi:MAG: hypothetical protein WC728_14445 [Elusimicrobiota bacterium]
MANDNLGEAVLVLSTDDKKYLDGLMSAKGKAAQWTEETQKMVEHQGRLGKAFERVGVDVFGGQLLHLAGVSGQTRSMVTLLGISVREATSAFGLAASAAMPWMFALGALAAVAYKVYEGQEKSRESLAELQKKQQESFNTTTDLVEKLRIYEAVVGMLPLRLRALANETERLNGIQRQQLITTEAESLAAVQRTLIVNRARLADEQAYIAATKERMRLGAGDVIQMGQWALGIETATKRSKELTAEIDRQRQQVKQLEADIWSQGQGAKAAEDFVVKRCRGRHGCAEGAGEGPEEDR